MIYCLPASLPCSSNHDFAQGLANSSCLKHFMEFAEDFLAMVSKPIDFVANPPFHLSYNKIHYSCQYSTLTSVASFHSVNLLRSVCVIFLRLHCTVQMQRLVPGAKFRVKHHIVVKPIFRRWV